MHHSKHRPLNGRLRSRTTRSFVCWKHMQWLTWWLVRLYLEQFVVTYCLEYNFACWCIECPSTTKRCSSGWDMWWNKRNRSNWHCHHRYDRSKRTVYENYVIFTVSRCVFQWSTQRCYKSKAVERCKGYTGPHQLSKRKRSVCTEQCINKHCQWNDSRKHHQCW